MAQTIIRQSIGSSTLGRDSRRRLQEGARKPLRTLAELAEELGLTAMQLAYRLHHDAEGPRPKFKTGGKRTPSSTWYDPREVRKWWRAHNAQQPAAAPALATATSLASPFTSAPAQQPTAAPALATAT